MLNLKSPADEAIAAAFMSNFSPGGLTILLADWLSHGNLAYETVDSVYFRRVLAYCNPALRGDDIPTSKTITRVVLREYDEAKEDVKAVLQTAVSKIHGCFDGWTSRRRRPFLGIHASFVDANFKHHSFLLGLPRIEGIHSGENLADLAVATFRDWAIADKVGCLTLDNAAPMDTAMVRLGEELGFDGEKRRIRCGPHIINLSVRAALYGGNKKSVEYAIASRHDNEEDDELTLRDAIEHVMRDKEITALPLEVDEEEDFEAAQQEDDNHYPVPRKLSLEELQKWREKGPIGKAHNMVVIIRNTGALNDRLKELQRGYYASRGLPIVLLELILNNATRWSSDKEMISRLLKVKGPAKQLFDEVEDQWREAGAKPNARPPLLNERLSAQEWQLLEIFDLFLEPFAVVTKILQGEGRPDETAATTAGFHQYLPQIDDLLSHLERAYKGLMEKKVDGEDNTRAINVFEEYHLVSIVVSLVVGLLSHLRFQDIHSIRLFKFHIKMAWIKLDKYYAKMTSPYYAAAVVFNPCYKWQMLDILWDGVGEEKAAQWKKAYERAIREIWETEYKYRNTPPSPQSLVASRRASKFMRRRQEKERAEADGTSMSSREAAVLDEYEQYCNEAPSNVDTYETDPYAYWATKKDKWPHLFLMAIDCLSVLSSSADSERDFSSAGRMIGPQRTNLSNVLLSAGQCLRSWANAGIYKPAVPLHLLDDVIKRVVKGEQAGIASN